MKIRGVLLRWYKSFNRNYEDYDDRVPGVTQRPWNDYLPPGVAAGHYPFIEIPLEPDITTVVGANESGKSHLIGAITKVLTGQDPLGEQEFGKTDLCHYASVRSKNANLWPNIGLLFETTHDEVKSLVKAATPRSRPLSSRDSHVIALILAPDGKDQEAILYLDDDAKHYTLNESALQAVRAQLPTVKFIDSKVAIADQISLARLIGAYTSEYPETPRVYDPAIAQEAAELLVSHTPSSVEQVEPQFLQHAQGVREKLLQGEDSGQDELVLEYLLFSKVLGIEVETLLALVQVPESARGYAEGLISNWNLEIDQALNLSRYWQQDQDFTLQVNYKQGILYFEITDKTGCIYTFRDRSSGLRYFLSYYIQAKAIAASASPTGAVILMDEPDCFLSVQGQRNLLAIFESMAGITQANRNTQLLYTTHSPFLINRNFPQRLRLVRKGDAEEGTQYVEKSRIRRYEPVRSALGVGCAHTLFMGATNIILEGATDQYAIVELIRAFITPENAGDFLDLNDVVFAPADSASAVENLIAASQWGDEPIPNAVVLLDNDVAGIEALGRITKKSKGGKSLVDPEAVLLITVVNADIDQREFVTTEDLIHPRIYSRAVEAFLQRWHPELYESRSEELQVRLRDPNFGLAGVVDATTSIFQEFVFDRKPRKYDKLGVLQEVFDLFPGISKSEDWADEIRDTEIRVRRLCQELKRKIIQGEQLERQRSGKYSVNRIVSDFISTRSTVCMVFDLQTGLIDRLQKEAKSIGQDAAALESVLVVLSHRLQKLRDGGHIRLSGANWDKWREYIFAIRTNPLSPTLPPMPEELEASGEPVESTPTEESKAKEEPTNA